MIEANGEDLPSGVYSYVLRLGREVITRKCVLVR